MKPDPRRRRRPPSQYDVFFDQSLPHHRTPYGFDLGGALYGCYIDRR